MLKRELGEGSHQRCCHCWLISPYRSWHRCACVTCHRAPMCLFITAWEVWVCACVSVSFCSVTVCVYLECGTLLHVFMYMLGGHCVRIVFIRYCLFVQECMDVYLLYILALLLKCTCLHYLCVKVCVVNKIGIPDKNKWRSRWQTADNVLGLGGWGGLWGSVLISLITQSIRLGNE